jgi:hypothetical protein
MPTPWQQTPRPADARAQIIRLAMKLVGTDLNCIDPYLLWALWTEFRGFGGWINEDDRLPFLIRVHKGVTIQELADVDAPDAKGKLAAIAHSYRRDPRTRYCSARVARRNVDALLRHPLVERADMGLPGLERPVDGRVSAVDLPPAFADVSGRLPAVGIIDHGIAFLNRRFQLDFPLGPPSNATLHLPRVVRLWDQWVGSRLVRPKHTGPNYDVVPPWIEERAFGYGRLLDPEELKREIARLVPHGDEMATYRRWGYAPAWGRMAHGTHVLDMAAGTFDPLQRIGSREVQPAGLLPVIAVQLPWYPEKDASGASLGVHVLDAMRFILDSAAPKGQSEDDPVTLERNVVVNLSDGAMAGSHNAGSLIEEALDELIAQHPGLSMSFAAGNAYRARAHAQGALAAEAKATLTWEVLPDDRTESFLEIWLPNPTEVDVELRLPNGERAFVASKDESAIWPQVPGAEVLAAGINLPVVANGKGHLVLLALRPTRPVDPADKAAPHGQYRVIIHNRDTREARFDAWIERDDPPLGEPGPRRQSRFAPRGAPWVSGGNTLNSIATGNEPIVVGGYRLRDDSLADYTAAGRPGDEGVRPTLVAPSDESVSAPGVRASGNRSGSTAIMNGTSCAGLCGRQDAGLHGGRAPRRAARRGRSGQSARSAEGSRPSRRKDRFGTAKRGGLASARNEAGLALKPRLTIALAVACSEPMSRAHR